MELGDLVIYNSNVAYHVHMEDIQQQHVNATIDHNVVKTPIKASNSNSILNKTNILSIMILILLLITITLTVLSVVTISQLNSKQSTLSS